MAGICIHVSTDDGQTDHQVWLNFPPAHLFAVERYVAMLHEVRAATNAILERHQKLIGEHMPCDCGYLPWIKTAPLAQQISGSHDQETAR